MEQSASFLGVHLRCANTYTRLNKRLDGQAYVGRCPKCLLNIRILPTDVQPGAKQHIFDCGRNRRPLSGNW